MKSCMATPDPQGVTLLDSKHPLIRLQRENLHAAEQFHRLVVLDRPIFTVDEIGRFAVETDLDRHEAFLTLLNAALGENGRAFLETWLRPAIRLQDPASYQQDPYCRLMTPAPVRDGAWQIRQESYQPYQLFPCGHTALTADGLELPALGYFAEPFAYPVLLENGREWMSLKPNEIATMREDIAAAQGDVLVLGLGMGYFAYHASQSEAVRSVTVVERSGRLIRLFKEHWLPRFPHAEKIRLVEADAFQYLRLHSPLTAFGFVFADLWHDAGDGLPMYAALRRLARSSPGADFRYWIEQDMLILLRSLIIDDWLNRAGKLETLLPEQPAFTLAEAANIIADTKPEWLE